MPPTLTPPSWLSELVKMIQVSAPASYTKSQDARLADLIANHRLLRDVALQQNPAWKQGADLPTSQQQFVLSSLNNARLASKSVDPGARFVELPHPQGPNEALMGASSIQAPGYFKGTPAENAVYVETLGSTHPGAGRGVLQAIANKYPDNPMYLQAMEEHGTPEFYTRRGFQEIPKDVDTPLGNNGLPEFWLPRGKDLRAGFAASNPNATPPGYAHTEDDPTAPNTLEKAYDVLKDIGHNLVNPSKTWDKVKQATQYYAHSPQGQQDFQGQLAGLAPMGIHGGALGGISTRKLYDTAFNYADKLSPAQKNLLEQYTTPEQPFHAWNINEALRSGKPLDKPTTEFIKELDNVIKQAPRSSQAFSVYRGQPTQSINDPAFMSVDLTRNGALDYAGSQNDTREFMLRDARRQFEEMTGSKAPKDDALLEQWIRETAKRSYDIPPPPYSTIKYTVPERTPLVAPDIVQNWGDSELVLPRGMRNADQSLGPQRQLLLPTDNYAQGGAVRTPEDFHTQLRAMFHPDTQPANAEAFGEQLRKMLA